MINKSMKSVQEFFPEININGEFAPFKDAKVKKVNIFSKSKRLDVCICSDTLIPASCIFGLENSLKEWLKLDLVTISPDFQAGMPAEEIVKKYWDSILLYVNRKLALSRGIMSGSIGRILDGKLIVQLSSKGSEILKSQNCDRIIEDMLSGWFGLTLRVDFKDAAADEAAMEEYLTFKEFEQSKVVNVTLTAAASAPTAAENGSKKQKPQNIGPGCIIHGKNFNEPLLNMSEVTQDSGRVAVWGDIFKVEFRELRSGKYICVFDATDYTSSLTLKLFVEKDDVDIYKEEIKEGVRIRARGEAQYDKFSKELTIFVSDMLQAQKEMKQDTAAEKRVELHLHTQMSSMDAITPAKELVKRAAQWGHRAVAITDHGVVQAFPDAFDSGKKNKIKIIYGVECYILDDNVPIVYNPSQSSLDDVFVVLDLETTGLNSDKDMITEIGAVKIKDGKIIDSFSSFVNPGIPIPAQITKLTGITNEMVCDAPEAEQVLLQFLEFINGAVLVAHNASFDMGFLKHFYRKMGEKIKNPVIDTLQLSRRMFPELGKYRLNVIASHLNVELLNHHRAVDDSRATGEIFIKCMEMLKEKGIKSIDEIESSLDGAEDYTKARSYHAIILVKNTVGLKNLYKIVSESHLKYYYKRPRVPKKLLMKYREGLILGSACEAGELYSAILDNKGDEVITKLARFYDYYEIQPLANNKFMINNGKVSGWDDLKNINKKIVRLGEKFKKPVVATCDIHFMDPEDEAFRRILMAGRGFADADDQAPLYFRTTNE
ncbi:MAG TPA: exonuclease domain-containing protein, partial [Clostridia bacterium]